MTKTARVWGKKSRLREAESETCEQWIYLLGKRETPSLPEDIQQVNSVASKYSVQPVPNEAYLDGEPPERILYAKTESWLNQI